jgi:hypothetical protein
MCFELSCDGTKRLRIWTAQVSVHIWHLAPRDHSHLGICHYKTTRAVMLSTCRRGFCRCQLQDPCKTLLYSNTRELELVWGLFCIRARLTDV